MKRPANDTDGSTAVLVWFRHDLRLADHMALHAAVASGRKVLPVFVLDDAAAERWAPGGAARWWLHHSLAALAESLAARGAPLVLRHGAALELIPALAREAGAHEVHVGAAAEPYARRTDRALADALRADGVALHRHRTTMLFNPDQLRTQAGGVYGVYTPFSRACFAAGGPKPPLDAPARIFGASPPRSDRLDDWGLLPEKPDWAGGLRATWTPGEAGAAARVKHFLKHGLAGYDARRNLPGIDSTSMLSPHIHFGEVSGPALWHAASAAPHGGKGLETFLRELLWREFSIYLLWHHQDLPDAPLRAEFARMPWRDDAAGLRAWQRGATGVPIVDAGMRQLWQTGWMHNRIRMVAASFLVKHLLIPWQDGEAWFWDTLVDADLAANSASWQWVAGCGADAAPYFRVFNPVLQGRKFDPDGAYVRRFVPELARLDDRHIHAPWEAPEAVLRQAGIVLGQTYPHPIVDLADGRARALAAYATVTGNVAAGDAA
jgi:deoxyribodipyrimidine photo-lyase